MTASTCWPAGEFKGARAEHASPSACGPPISSTRSTLSGIAPAPWSQLPETKDTNPKDAIGTRKAGIGNVPACVLMELGVAMKEGARTGAYNWRVAGVSARVRPACGKYVAWWEGGRY